RSRRARRLASLAGSAVRSLPAGPLGGLAVLLFLASNPNTIGPLGLLLPVGSLGAYVVVAGLLTGVGFAAIRLDRGRASSTHPHVRRVAASALSAAVVVGALLAGGVVLDPGAAAPALAAEPLLDGVVRPAPLDDPGAPGPYAVRSFSYGSGTDRLRPAFGAGAAIVTRTVDATPVLQELGWGSDAAREWFWGFGRDALPLNGLAWLPVGDGPFPLVLMVHGNHAMGDFSEPGYAYLGEHLASRGFIAVSIDEDFLNGSWAGDWGGSEQLARAWLLLLHADLWRSWAADPASPLHGIVDADRIALIGHSRGGEAASIAAVLAGTRSPAAAGLEPWPTGLHIGAVVAIAPSDGQYQGGRVLLRDTDYLTLQGGHDGDATSWMGIRQYARTVVDAGGFRAALWSYRSNHGQFNSAWGRSDQGLLGGALLDLGPLAGEEGQQDVARTAIGAFLEASLHGRSGYRDLFRRPMVGREWLPEDDIYLVRSSDDTLVPLTTSGASRGVGDVVVTTSGFDTTRSRLVPLRSLLPDQLTTGTELRWSTGQGTASWEARGIASIDGAGQATALTFALANGTPIGGGAGRLDPLVEVSTTDGVTVRVPLSHWGALPPPLEVNLVKSELLAHLSSMDLALDAPPEIVLQTYELRLDELAAADPAFRPEHVDALRLIVDRAEAGALWVTEVGLTRA
ncbi:MAG TPA: hypothetical protein VHL56_05450, partial [Candidatus Limnocylindrales bacterium]|nr:hypothetical protein [Candidatus Limnocylindrales bacterium]